MEKTKAKKEEKEGTHILDDRQETNQKQKLVTLTGIIAVFATTEKGINNNRSELFTTCTHHTHRVPAWQPAIILQVLHERWLSYPLTLFVLHPSRYP